MTAPVEVTGAILREWPLPAPESEKHERGVLLVVAGSASTPGAALLAGEAAFRAGAAKLQIATPASVSGPLGVALPEARACGFEESETGDIAVSAAKSIAELAEGADAVLLGPGFVDPDAAELLLARLVPLLSQPVVIDALGSAYVGRHVEEVSRLGTVRVLTVNPHELSQTLGVSEAELDQDLIGATLAMAQRADTVVLCGGSTKVVAVPDGALYVITAGGPGLAISGSGDVQAGLVSGLLARGAEPAQAAVWGGWLHASAGDRLAARKDAIGFLARELPAEVPALLAALTPD